MKILMWSFEFCDSPQWTGEFQVVYYLTAVFCPFLHRQIYHNIKYSSELQWNHVGLCMLNSGTIRTAIDERYKNGASVFFFPVLLSAVAPVCQLKSYNVIM